MDSSKFYIKYKEDIIAFLTLAILFLVLLIIYWGHLGSIIIDSGKEAYYPQQILHGELFGKDLFSVYGPISYQLNSLLFLLFGEHLNVLYLAGAVNALCILLMTYLISRQITSYEVSWVICYFIIVVFFFNTSVSNYIFPYTYAVVYSLSFFLLTLFFCILYVRFSRPIFIPISSFFFALSIFSKFEFALFIVVIAYLILIYRPLPLKYIIYSLISFLVVPIVSIGILFFQGFSLNDLAEYIKLFVALSHSKNLQQFYTFAVGFYPSKKIILTTWTFLQYFFVSFLILFITFYIIFLLIRTLSSFIKYAIFVTMIVTLTITVCDISRTLPKEIFVGFLSWLPFVCALISIFILFGTLMNIIKVSKKDKLNKPSLLIKKLLKLDNVDNKTVIYLIVLMAAVISILKCFFYVGLQVYGPYLLLLPLLVSTIFLFEYIPRLTNYMNPIIWKQSGLLVILFLGLFFLFRTDIEMKQGICYLISTPRGSIYTDPILGKPFMKAIEYVKKNISPEESVLVVPEGVLLNFLTDRPTNSIHINIMPIEMELFGEDKIINDLKKNPPDYIFVNNRNFYGMIFGINYGQKTFDYIYRNYTFQTLYGKTFRIVIFKKK